MKNKKLYIFIHHYSTMIYQKLRQLLYYSWVYICKNLIFLHQTLLLYIHYQMQNVSATIMWGNGLIIALFLSNARITQKDPII